MATILVVEDHLSTRNAYAELLQGDGYRVIAPVSAAAAMALAKTDRPAVDVILTELRVAGASGPELAAQARRHRPGLRGTVYVTRYTVSKLAADALSAGDRVLFKPVDFPHVERAIAELLES